MVRKYKKFFKLFFAWQDEQEEEWLRSMAKKGWLLNQYNLFYYTFEKIEPTDYIYRLDYKPTRNCDIDEYLQIYDDAGWEHVTQYFGWHYFRVKADQAVTLDIYTDNDSKLYKYKGVLKLLLIVLGIIIINSISVMSNSMSWSIRVIYIVLAGLLTYGVYTTYKKIKRIKNNI